MTHDSQPPVDDATGTAPSSPVSSNSSPGHKLLAPLWHTAILILVLLAASVSGSRGRHPLATHGKIATYLWSMGWEWLLVAFTWLGIRKRRTLSSLVGGRWTRPQDFFLDVMVAAGFWVVAAVVLGTLGKLLHLDQAAQLDDMRRSLGFLTPSSRLELAVWFCISLSAGFCEEILFRGYLQEQLIIVTRSTLLGVLFSAVVFGASHGYEGLPRMLLVGIFGILFGLLAWWRKSLRPGIIAHAWHDALSGAILRVMK